MGPPRRAVDYVIIGLRFRLLEFEDPANSSPSVSPVRPSMTTGFPPSPPPSPSIERIARGSRERSGFRFFTAALRGALLALELVSRFLRNLSY